MTARRRRSAAWQRARAIVLAAVVLVGGFGLPAFDVIAYHWHQAAEARPDGLAHLQPFGTPGDHSVQCVLTHNAPAPRLAAAPTDGLGLAAPAATMESATRPASPPRPSRHLSDQPRAPPSSIA